ncbi:TPA: hypothetical protein N0F65_003669, partial [Lagenidium giganteum]
SKGVARDQRSPRGTEANMAAAASNSSASNSASNSPSSSANSSASNSPVREPERPKAGDRKPAEDDESVEGLDEDIDDAEAEADGDDDGDAAEDEDMEGNDDAVDPAAQLSKEEKAALRKEDDQALQQQRELQAKSLEAVKQSIAEDTDWESKPKAERRLQFLMAQSDVFTSFLMGGSSSVGKEMTKSKSKATANSAPQSRRGKNSKNEQADAQAMLAMEEARFTRITRQPKSIKFGQMKPYQLEGLNWMVRLHDCGVNGILADEMGLGKTLQSISLLAYLREERAMEGPHIIIVPKSTVGNWMRELKRWCPVIRAFKFMGSKDERAVQRETVARQDFDAVVLSYEVAIIEKATLQKINWKYMLIDEAHRVKNEHSKLSRVVREFKVEHRLLITGTPLQNNLHELWALLNFLLPDVFTDSEDFDSWFNVDEQEGQENVIKKLHTVLRPFLLRRLKTDVEHSLPPKTETKLYVGLSEMQREWYMRMLHRDAAHLNAIGGSDRVRLLNILMQLRKVCNHPYLFEGAEPGPPFKEGPHLWENCGKLTLLSKLLPKLKAQDSRVLIFCQMTSMLDILEDYLRYFNYEYCRLDGQTKGEDRDRMMEEFNEPGSSKFAFLLSTRAGGLGINLATADIVILYDSDWNPQVDLQAMDRAHRIGQTKPVRVFRFIAEGTVEEKIVERAERKLYLDAAIIQQGRLAQQNRKLSKDELMTMVRFGADEIFNAKGSMITDDDIDAILAKGEERTESMKSKIEQDVQHNLANFSLSGDANVSSLYEFEGEVFSRDTNSGQVLPSTFIALPQRERKTNYNEDDYYRKQAGIVKAKKAKKTEEIKVPVVHDYQFFQQERMVELLTKKTQIENRRKELSRLIREAKSEEQRLKGRKKKTKPENPDEVGVQESEENASANNSAEEDNEDENLRSVQLEKELQETELSEQDAEELDRLEKEGFGDWTRRDLKQFITSCERYGRADKTSVCAEVAAVLGKDLGEVERYFDTFWKRMKELKDHAKYLDKIERGEKRLERNEVVKQALARKCSRYSNPLRDMKLHYPNGYKSKGFTLEEDVFLVVMMNKFGPLEHWSEIRDEIRQAWQFRFDWFFKSRTIGELQKRGEMLTRMIEKENEEMKNKATKEEDSLTKKATKKSSSSTSSSSKTKSSSSSSSSKKKSESTSSSSNSKSSSSRGKKRSSSSSTKSSKSMPRELPSLMRDGIDHDDDDEDDDEELEDNGFFGGVDMDGGRGHPHGHRPHQPRQLAKRRSSIAVMSRSSLQLGSLMAAGAEKAQMQLQQAAYEKSTTYPDLFAAASNLVPRSKASTFLLGVVEKARSGSKSSSDPLAQTLIPNVNNLLNHTNRKKKASLTGAKAASVARRLAMSESSRLLPVEHERRETNTVEPDTRDHRSLPILINEMHVKKQEISRQMAVLGEILLRLHEAESEEGQKQLTEELITAGILKEIVTTMREFRFNVALQVLHVHLDCTRIHCTLTARDCEQTTAVNILAFLAGASELYAFMMCELNLGSIIQKSITIHSTHEKLVMMGLAVFHTIMESRKASNARKYKAAQAQQEKQRATMFAEAVAAEMRFKQYAAAGLRPPMPNSGSTRKFVQPVDPFSPEKLGYHSEVVAGSDPGGVDDCDLDQLDFVTRGRMPNRSASRLRRALSVDKPPLLSATYHLRFAKKYDSEAVPGALIPPQFEFADRCVTAPADLRLDRRDSAPSLLLSVEKNALRPTTSPSPRTPSRKQLSLPTEGLAVAAYTEVPSFVEPSPLSKRMSGGKVNHVRPLTKRKSRKDQSKDLIQGVQDDFMKTLSPTTPGRQTTLKFDPFHTPPTEQDRIDQQSSSGSDNSKSDHVDTGLSSPTTTEYSKDFEQPADNPEADLRRMDADGELLDILQTMPVSQASEANEEQTAAATCIQRHARGRIARRKLQRQKEGPTERSRKTRNDRAESRRRLYEAPRAKSNRAVTFVQSAPGQPSRRQTVDTPNLARGRRKSQQGTSSVVSPPAPVHSRTQQSKAQSSNSNSSQQVRAEACDDEMTEESALRAIQVAYARGLEHHKSNNLSEAIAFYEEALSVRACKREFASIYINLGSALMSQKKYSEALQAFEQAERIQPGNVKAVYNCALALVHVGKPSLARRRFQRVLDLDSTHVKAQQALKALTGSAASEPSTSDSPAEAESKASEETSL